jgi:cytochrome P450
MTDDTLIILATGLVVAATAVCLKWVFGGRGNPKCMHIPGNNGQLPILGDTMRLLNPQTMASYQVSSKQRWGPVWQTSVLFKKCVFVAGTEHIKQLASEEMSKRNTQACFPPHHSQLFGENSILVTSGEEHDKVRKVINPLLQPSLYKREIDMAAASFVEDCMKDSLEFKYIPLVPKFRQFTLRVAVRIVVGEKRWQEWAETSNKKLLTLLDDFAIWSKGLLSPPTASIPFTPAYKAMMARGRIKNILLDVIKEENDVLELESSQPAASRQTGRSLVRMFLEGKSKDSFVTEDVIVDNILTFLFAGHETTASLLTSAFYELANNSSLRKRLQSSLNDELDGSSDKILIAFISEVLRMYPAAPFTMREVVREGINMGDDLGIVPPGYLVTYSIAGTLLDDETTFPKPKAFDLDRWLSKSDAKISSIPFGGGNRVCPGRFLAISESLALLRLVLNHNGFEWELKEGQNLTWSYTPGFFPADGLLMKIAK